MKKASNKTANNKTGRRSGDKPLVSVIVPVYNGEKYLKEMLDSVRGQNLKELEVLCINDGSEDRSGDIIQDIAKRDRRVRYLEQEHADAGAARNRALKMAQGKYVVFWDADDRFDRYALERMCRKMERRRADVCVCGVCEFTDTGKVYEAEGYLRMDMLPDKDPFNKFDIRERLFWFGSNVLWNKMFRRQFILKEKLQFQSIPQANDTAFVMLAMYLASAITCVDKKLVYYRTNNADSLTGRSSQTAFCPYQSFLYTFGKLREYPNFGKFKGSFCSKAARGIFRGMNNQTSFDAYAQLYDFLKREGLAALELDECRAEDMEEQWIYEDLERMKTFSAGDFLLYKTNERRMDRDQLKHTLRRVRKKLAVLLAVNERLKQIKRLAGRRMN